MTSGAQPGSPTNKSKARDLKTFLELTLRAASFIILIVLFALGPALASDQQSTDDGDQGSSKAKARLAPDLVDSLKKHAPQDVVRVILTGTRGDADETKELISGLGGVIRGAYRKVGQLVVDIPAESVEQLVNVPGLEYIAPDRPIAALASHIETTTGASQVYKVGWPDWGFFLTSSLLGGFNGSGVTVAVIDSGVEPDQTDLRDNVGHRRVLLNMDFTGAGLNSDPYGHGTHVAGIVAGNGASSIKAGYDFSGIAPAANLVSLRVLDDRGRGYLSNVIAAIDLAITTKSYYKIGVVNLSLAAPPVDSFRDDPLCRAVDRAVGAGIVVVAAAGNFGLDQNGQKTYGGITSPGICPTAITVGATNSRATDIRSDDAVAPFSSRGPTRSRSIDPVTGAVVYDNLAKPDLVAPGVRVVSLESYANTIVTAHPELDVWIGNNINRTSRYMLLSGTSMATPMVSGAAALMLQANPSLTPALVKAILMYSAQIMEGPDLFEQGAGMLNIEGAVRSAASLSKKASSVPPGQPLLVFGLPRPRTTVASEAFVWSKSLIWNQGLITGDALLAVQQPVYTQSLIWGIRDLTVFGTGVTWNDGLYADDYVVFGKNGQWAYVTWDQGIALAGGLIWGRALYGSGLIWQNSLMIDAFYTLDPTSLIWGYSRYGYDLSLIWGLTGFDSSLIWGCNAL